MNECILQLMLFSCRFSGRTPRLKNAKILQIYEGLLFVAIFEIYMSLRFIVPRVLPKLHELTFIGYLPTSKIDLILNKIYEL